MESLAAGLFYASERFMHTVMCDGHTSDLRPGQFMVLKLLAASPQQEVTPTDVSQCMGLRPPSITPLIGRLEERGYLCRTHSKVDRRKVYLTITPQGHEAIRRANDELLAFYSRLAGSLEPQEAQTLITLLGKVSDSVHEEKGEHSC